METIFEKLEIKLVENEKYIYKALKDYMISENIADMTEGEKIIDAKLDSLYVFYSQLPDSCKTKELEEQFETMAQEVSNALNVQLMQLAKCPFLKIEFDNKSTLDQLKKVVDYVDESMKFLTGYIQGDAMKTQQMILDIKSELHAQKQGGDYEKDNTI